MPEEKKLPDVSTLSSDNNFTSIDWVGMTKIKVPVLVRNKSEKIQVLASIQVFLSLDNTKSRGIHMSRLYLILQNTLSNKELTPLLLDKLSQEFLASHKMLSKNVKFSISFEFFESKKSLLSDNYGWKSYPTELTHSFINEQKSLEKKVNINYSSTCPCSSALSRQLISKAFEQEFAINSNSDNSVAINSALAWLSSDKYKMPTPHSQRSIAQIKVKLAKGANTFDLSKFIEVVEAALKTPVQAAVKREDEQEFAKLNGENLMFCEDAARILSHALAKQNYDDYWIRVDHLESLHQHNATAIKTKNILGGYQPDLN